MLMAMNLKQISHVLVLADTLNFNKTAKLVHLSQSALSKSIAALEDELGIRIFERSTAKVQIAPSGKHVVQLARHLMSEATSFRKNIEYLKTGELGSVAVGSGPFPAACFLDACIRRFHQTYPSVSMRLQIDHWANLMAALRAGEIDFFTADIRNLENDSSFDIVPLGGVTIALYCCRSHPLVAQNASHEIRGLDLLPYTFATVKLPPLMFFELKQSMGLERDQTFAATIESDDIYLLNRIIAGSDIILATSNLMMSGNFGKEDLVKLNVQMNRNRFGEWALVKMKDRTLTPSANLLANLLIEITRDGCIKDDEVYGSVCNPPLNFMRDRPV
jgi:DNA-binding transcriptional LysR family regulator